MANTYELISAVTTTGASSITFTSIPNTYKDIVFRCFWGWSGGSMSVRWNGYTGSYSEKSIRNNSGTVAGINDGGGTSIVYVGESSVQGDNKNRPTIEVYIPNYADSNQKTIWFETSEVVQSTSSSYISLGMGNHPTTAAISSFTFLPVGGSSPVTVGTIYCALYGIK